MSDLRPVQEIWGPHTAYFVERDQLITFLHDLAARVGTSSEGHEYGDVTAVWFENGQRVLAYIATDDRFNTSSFADSLEEQGVTINRSELDYLIGNVKQLATAWTRSLGPHGELVFYVDA
jgi:hypothetical protein